MQIRAAGEPDLPGLLAIYNDVIAARFSGDPGKITRCSPTCRPPRGV